MMNNIISIDLDKINGFHKFIIDGDKGAIVPTPCTLTDAVEKLGAIWVNDFESLKTKEDVQRFKREYLYKDNTLEDGIYEVEIGKSIQMVYFKDGKWSVTKNGKYFDGTHEFNNTRKIADL